MTKNTILKWIAVGIMLCWYNNSMSTSLEKEDFQQKRSTPSAPKENGSEYFIKYHPGKKELSPGTKFEFKTTNIFDGKEIHSDGKRMWIEGNIFSGSSQ